MDKENEKQNKRRRVELINKMENLQVAKENKEEDKEDHLQEKELFWEIYRENRNEEQEARSKSRSLWLKVGDKNTSFFHNSMKIRRARNQIDKIQVDGQEIRGAKELKKEAHNHFKNILTANGEAADYDNFLQHIPNKINEGQNAEILKEISKEEIEATVWSLHPDKAPGPDGFKLLSIGSIGK